MRRGSILPYVTFAETAILILTALIAVNAVWGLASADDTAVSGWLRAFAPLEFWFGAGCLLILLAAVFSALRHDLPRRDLALMLLAYLVGVAVSETAKRWVEPRGGVPFDSQISGIYALGERSFMLWPALPMFAIYFLLLRRSYPETLRWGSWKPKERSDDTDRYAGNWRLYFIYFFAFAVVPLALAMQASVGFAPVRSGNAFVYVFPLVSLASFNGFSEEVLFRGLFQPAFAHRLGVHRGIVVQGVFFGLHHWGASPDAISGLPTAIVTCGLGILWGRSVRATGGIGWAITTHALVDLAFFSAHFVAVD